MKKYFLDSSILVDFFNDRGDAKGVIGGLEGELTCSWVCMAELGEGIQHKRDKSKWEKDIRGFFLNLDKIHGMDMEIAEKFGEIRNNLRERGEIIADIDIIIAATCIAKGLVLITGNKKHFARIKELEVY